MVASRQVCLSQKAPPDYLPAILQAVPDAEIVHLDELGIPLGAATLNAPALLISYDLFIAGLGNPAIGENLSRLAAQCAWVQAGSAGADDSMLAQIRSCAPRYCNARSLHAIPVAQYVFAQLLRWHRRLDQLAAQQAEHLWQPFMVECELTGRTLGILGYGGIGREIGRLGHAFGMEVLGWRRQAQADEHAEQVLSGEDGLKRILGAADALVLCLPDSEQTRGLMNAERLAQLKTSTMLVNVGRGSVMDEEALVQQLHSGKIACAALDTTADEPLPADSPLWDAPNCYISPHNSAWSPLSATRLRELFCTNLKHWLAGEQLHNEEEQ